MIRRLFLLTVLGLCLAPLGCGSKEYDIPKIDPEEAKVQEEEINKAMEEEMQRQMGGGKKK